MSDRSYFLATQRPMVIRLLEPAQFIQRTVTERRPLSMKLDDANTSAQNDGRNFAICLVVCLTVLVAISYLITYALEHFINSI